VTGYLLDTHVVLWANAAPERLGSATTRLLTDPATAISVSAVSIAEMAIKRSIGKLTMSVPIDDLRRQLRADELVLSSAQAQLIEALPMLHRDPFDRLLAAQAKAENLVLVTAHDRLLAYPISTLDART